MKKRRALPLLLLLLSLLLLAAAAGKIRADFSFPPLPAGGRGMLLTPREGDGRPAPGALLLWGSGTERRKAAALAVELVGRGYTVMTAPAESGEAAWAALSAQPGVRAESMAAVCWAEGLDALSSLAALAAGTETGPRALLCLEAESVPEGLSGANRLCLLRGQEDSVGALEGYFAEGSAYRAVTLSAQRGEAWRRAALPHICEWLGSSLGRPRDGACAPETSLLLPCRALFLAAVLCALLSLLSLPLARQKHRPERVPRD